MPHDMDHSMAGETWRLFRILSEFVDGFETLTPLEKAVTIFGSARTPPEDPYYLQAVEAGRRFAEEKFAVITGGGPGIMEAANRGAYEARGESVGLNIALPMEQHANPYLTHSLTFRYFFVRKVMFVKYASGFVIFPGGFGTMDEFFESMTLIQTLKIEPFPVVCIGHEFWDGLLDWIRQTMRDKFQYISPNDMDLFTVTDDVDEAVQIISASYAKRQDINKRHPHLTDANRPTAEGTRQGIDPRVDNMPVLPELD